MEGLTIDQEVYKVNYKVKPYRRCRLYDMVIQRRIQDVAYMIYDTGKLYTASPTQKSV